MRIVGRMGAWWFSVAILIAGGACGGVSGCGAAPGDGSKVMVKDPPPLAAEETTEELLKNEAKSRVKSAQKSRVGRR